MASGLSKKDQKSKIQAPWMSEEVVPDFSVELGAHPFNNSPIPQLWHAIVWGKKMNWQHPENYRAVQQLHRHP